MGYRNLITLRYAAAIMLIACVLTTSFLLIERQLRNSDESAAIINISGKQRMLSQRIALMAHMLSEAESKKQAEQFIWYLQDAVDEMARNNRLLHIERRDELSPELLQLYEGEHGVQNLLEKYLSTAKLLLVQVRALGWYAAAESPHVAQLQTMATDELLAKLNAIVYTYQIEADNRLSEYKSLERIMYLIGMLVLILEVIFIFSPLAKQIAEKTQELTRSNEELTEFSYRISHDLRAPIVSSQGLARMARKAVENGKQDIALKSLQHIDNSLEKLNQLVEDVLNLMRVKFSADEEKELVDVHALYTDAVEKLSHLPDAERIVFGDDIELNGLLRCKRIHLQQIIDNLLSNAVKYHDTSISTPRIVFAVYRDGERLIIAVRDNGIGVPKEVQSKLFGMFQRLHPGVSFGSGLGLYMVQQNAQYLGGYAEYVPQEKGSEFRIILPKPEIVSHEAHTDH